MGIGNKTTSYAMDLPQNLERLISPHKSIGIQSVPLGSNYCYGAFPIPVSYIVYAITMSSLTDIDNYVFGSSTNITVSEGSSWVLNFTVEANPIIHSNNISLADGRPVSDRITTTQNSVTFREVAQSDAGQYIISTSNKAGTAMSTIHLNLTRGTYIPIFII